MITDIDDTSDACLGDMDILHSGLQLRVVGVSVRQSKDRSI